MQPIGSPQPEENVLNESFAKVKEFADVAGQKLGTVEWQRYADMSRPIVAWTCLGLGVVTLFLFGHLFSCIYALVVGFLIGVMEVDIIYSMVVGSVPQVGDIKETFKKSGLSSEHPGSLGVCYVFASLPLLSGSFTPLYFAGLSVMASGVMHVFSIFIKPTYQELTNSEIS